MPKCQNAKISKSQITKMPNFPNARVPIFLNAIIKEKAWTTLIKIIKWFEFELGKYFTANPKIAPVVVFAVVVPSIININSLKLEKKGRIYFQTK